MESKMPEDSASGLEITPEIMFEFINESEAQLLKAEQAFLALESGHGGRESLNSAFRAFHTMKGTADYLGFRALKDLAHFCEEILDRARGSGRSPDKNVLSLLIKTVDEVKAIIKDGLSGKYAYDKEKFENASRESLEKLSAAIIRGANMAEPGVDSGDVMDFSQNTAAETRPALKIDSYKFEAMMNSLNELAVAGAVLTSGFEESIRADGTAHEKVKSRLDALKKIAVKLNYESFALKMMSFQHLFNKMTRLTRDLSLKSGKKIKLLLNGGDTEIDREIIDNLAEPLMHILRNAVDHGIEGPAERESAGKPAAGMVSLSASCRDGHITISVSDDGQGLDREKILGKAVKAGLVHEGYEIEDEKIHELIMLPGFTTAEQVSELSGRGVGMDAVRKAVEALKGNIKIKSIKGQGTKISMIFPVNLALIEGLTVLCRGETYVVPASNIVSAVTGGAAKAGQEYGSAGAADPESCDFFSSENYPGRYIIINMERNGISRRLPVEKVVSQQKVAVKNIPGLKLEKTLFSGAVILPDGKPALILSPERLIQNVS